MTCENCLHCDMCKVYKRQIEPSKCVCFTDKSMFLNLNHKKEYIELERFLKSLFKGSDNNDV